MLAQAAPPAAPGAQAAQIDCTAGRSRASVWDRARAPHVARYCDFLSHAEARLEQEPRRAEQSAAAAGALLPEQAAPVVLRARAAAAQGRHGEAKKLFEQALALDPGATRDPRALVDWAASLREVGETSRAIEAYRALLPRVDTLPGDDARTRAQIDAAVALMLAGPAQLDAAAAVLRDAVARGAPSLRAAAQAVLALALDRAGAKAEAAAQAAEAQRAGAQVALAPPGGRAAVGWQVEALAVQARLREATDPGAAGPIWDAYLARAGQGPWAAHAREHAGARRAPAPRKGGR